MEDKAIFDLYEKIFTLETKVKVLEDQLARSNQQVFELSGRRPDLPESGLLSKNFWVRAFTAWGHVFVAQLVISAVVGLVFFIVYGLIFSSLIKLFG